LQESVKRSGNAGCTDQDIGNRTIRNSHAIDSDGHLFRVGHIASDAERVSAVLLDLNMSEVQFGFTPGHQGDARSQAREPNRQALSDTASSSGNQDATILKRSCCRSHKPL
jgi:hypothetical protein